MPPLGLLGAGLAYGKHAPTHPLLRVDPETCSLVDVGDSCKASVGRAYTSTRGDTAKPLRTHPRSASHRKLRWPGTALGLHPLNRASRSTNSVDGVPAGRLRGLPTAAGTRSRESVPCELYTVTGTPPAPGLAPATEQLPSWRASCSGRSRGSQLTVFQSTASANGGNAGGRFRSQHPRRLAATSGSAHGSPSLISVRTWDEDPTGRPGRRFSAWRK